MNLKNLTLCSVAAGTTLCAALAPSVVLAANISPISYSMPNGDGQVSGGTYNYWDANYSGSGSTTTDGAALSGGLGKLTDGVISTSFWYNLSNAAGTGEYVGWSLKPTPNPLITFNFAGSPLISTILIHMDNSGIGGVFAPATIWIDGVNKTYTRPTYGTVGSVSFTGLNLLGSSHTIRFVQAIYENIPNDSPWTFVSEISFAGAVPEPETYAMLLAGLGLLGSVARRRKLKAS